MVSSNSSIFTVYKIININYFVGVYVGDNSPEDQSLFVTERCCFSDLLDGLSSLCPCGMTIMPWALESVIQVGMVDIHIQQLRHNCTNLHVLVRLLERPCPPSCIFLPPLPSAKEDMVQLEDMWWALSSKPEVCVYFMKN